MVDIILAIYSRYVYDLTVTRMSRDIIMIATTSLIYYVRVVLKTIAIQTDGNQLGCQYLPLGCSRYEYIFYGVMSTSFRCNFEGGFNDYLRSCRTLNE